MDSHRWEKACFGAWYQCRIHECPRGEKEYEDETGMGRHLRHKHRDRFMLDVSFDQVAFEKALLDFKIIVH